MNKLLFFILFAPSLTSISLHGLNSSLLKLGCKVLSHPHKDQLSTYVKTETQEIALQKGLEIVEWTHPKQKDQYVSKLFNTIKNYKPELLASMHEYYSRRFAAHIDGKELTPADQSVLREFTHVAAHTFRKIPLPQLRYLVTHDPEARAQFTDAAVKDITKVDEQHINLLVTHNKNPYFYLFNFSLFDAIDDEHSQKIITSVCEHFKDMNPEVLACVLGNFHSQLQQKFVNLTIDNITKKYSPWHMDFLLKSPQEIFHLTTSIKELKKFFQTEDHSPVEHALAEAILQNMHQVPLSNIVSAPSKIITKVLGSDIFIKQICNNLETYTPILEQLLNKASYKTRGKILNILKEYLNQSAQQQNHIVADTLITDNRLKLIRLYNSYSIPFFRSTLHLPPIKQQESQTQAHALMYSSDLQKLEKELLQDQDVKKIIKAIHTQELDEAKNDRFTFFHACKWDWDLRQDLFTKLMEIKLQKNLPNYRFLRFESDYHITNEEQNIRKVLLDYGRIDHDLLPPLRPRLFFMNHALFGNLHNVGSNTFAYWYYNNDCSTIQISLQDIFKQTGFDAYYEKYQREIHELETLHKKSENKGTLLLISVDPQTAPHYIYPAEVGGYKGGWFKKNLKIGPVLFRWKRTTNLREIIQTLKKNPFKLDKQTDSLEYCMILTNDYALNPDKAGKDIKIYPFHLAADTSEYQQYCEKRDQLMRKIARDLAEKESPSTDKNILFNLLATQS